MTWVSAHAHVCHKCKFEGQQQDYTPVRKSAIVSYSSIFRTVDYTPSSKIFCHADSVQGYINHLAVSPPRRRRPMLVLGQLLWPRLALHAAGPVPGIRGRRALVSRGCEGRSTAVGGELLAGLPPATAPRAARQKGDLLGGLGKQRVQDWEAGHDDAGCNFYLGPACCGRESVGGVCGTVGGEQEDVAIGGGEDDTIFWCAARSVEETKGTAVPLEKGGGGLGWAVRDVQETLCKDHCHCKLLRPAQCHSQDLRNWQT